MATDETGRAFIEVSLPNGENVRVTLVEESWANSPGIRLQIRDASGHLRQGPEIPASAVGQVVAAVIELVRDKPEGAPDCLLRPDACTRTPRARILSLKPDGTPSSRPTRALGSRYQRQGSGLGIQGSGSRHRRQGSASGLRLQPSRSSQVGTISARLTPQIAST